MTSMPIPDDVWTALKAYRRDRTAARWTALSQLWVGEMQVIDLVQRLYPAFPDALPLPVDGVIEDNAELFQWQALPDPGEVERALAALQGIVTARSRLSYEETLKTLEAAIVSAGNTIFASIDQAAAATSVGMTLQPTTLIVFGNPRAGTPLMAAYPLLALDLPLRLLVWEDAGGVNLAFVTMSEIAKRYGTEGMDERIGAIDRAMQSLIGKVT